MLLSCPGVEMANQIKNSSEMTPTVLAQINGHAEIAQRLLEVKVIEIEIYILPSKEILHLDFTMLLMLTNKI